MPNRLLPDYDARVERAALSADLQTLHLRDTEYTRRLVKSIAQQFDVFYEDVELARAVFRTYAEGKLL